MMASLKSPFASIEVPKNISIVNFVLSNCHKYPDHVALIDGVSGERTTYGQLMDYTRRVGSALAQSGLKWGEVVAMCSPNCPEYAWTVYGAMRAGAVITGINPAYTAYEIQHILDICQAVVMFVAPDQLPSCQKALKNYKNLRAIYVFGQVEGYTDANQLLLDDGTFLPRFHVDGSEVALLPFSSGTTGLSKGVQLTHTNIISNILQICHPEVGQVDYNRDVCIATLPFYHVFGQQTILNAYLYAGCTVITLPRFEFHSWLKVIQDYKVSMLHLVPPMALLLAKQPETSTFDLSCVSKILVGGAPVAEEIMTQLLKKIPKLRLIHAYGMTEMTSGSIALEKGNTSYSSVGHVYPNSEVKFVDINTGEILGPGVNGELCMSGPNIFTHYKTGKNSTQCALTDDGWFHSGDIGHYKNNGEIYIVDRLKNLIKYKGYQVPPAELEDLLLKHPDINDAAVIGVPDEAAGEVPRAYVVRKPGSRVTEMEVKQFVAGQVSHIKHLRGGVVFTKQIPKSPSGKILHRILRSLVRDEMKSQL